MMGDMSDDQPWAARFTLGTACVVFGGRAMASLAGWDFVGGETQRGKSLCGSDADRV